jgi:hypothetical protein
MRAVLLVATFAPLTVLLIREGPVLFKTSPSFFEIATFGWLVVGLALGRLLK